MLALLGGALELAIYLAYFDTRLLQICQEPRLLTGQLILRRQITNILLVCGNAGFEHMLSRDPEVGIPHLLYGRLPVLIGLEHRLLRNWVLDHGAASVRHVVKLIGSQIEMRLLHLALHVNYATGRRTLRRVHLVLNRIHRLLLHRVKLIWNQVALAEREIAFLINRLHIFPQISALLHLALILILDNLPVLAGRPVCQPRILPRLVNELVISEAEVSFRHLLAADLADIVGHGVGAVLLEVLLGHRLVVGLVVAVGKLLHPILHDPLLLLLHRIILIDILQPLFQKLVVEVLIIGGLILHAARPHVQLAAPKIFMHLLVGLVHRQVLGLESGAGGRVDGVLILIRLSRYVPHIEIALPRILLPIRHIRGIIPDSLLVDVARRGIYQFLSVGLLGHL